VSLSEEYQLVQRIGSGAAGVLYLAESSTGPVAIRQFESQAKPDSEAWRESRQAFLVAGRQALGLTHPYIVPVLDVIDEGGEAFVASEYVTAETLASAMAGRRLTPEETGPLLRELALALDFAHSHGVVHGDLTPSNIFLFDQGAKVADFAISPRASADPLRPIPPHLVHRYLSPEHLRAPQSIDAQSDQYSLAVIAYELYTGQSPYGGAPDLTAAILTAEIPPPSRVNPQLPAVLDQPIMRALDRDPSRRFGSCIEFVSALGAGWKAHAGGYAGRRWSTLLAALAALLLVGLGLAYYHNRKPVQPPAAPVAQNRVDTQPPPPAPPEPLARKAPPADAQPSATRKNRPADPEKIAGIVPETKTNAPEPRQAPPPLVEPASQAFKIQVFSREHAIHEDSSFAYGDQILGELADGDIKAAVTFDGQPQPRGQLRLVWEVDSVVHDQYPVQLDRLMEYRNEPTVGTYVVTLYYQKRAVKKFSFRITP
jgi:tRNA A-37 threonylcarbamoyl transferase component Bud32